MCSDQGWTNSPELGIWCYEKPDFQDTGHTNASCNNEDLKTCEGNIPFTCGTETLCLASINGTDVLISTAYGSSVTLTKIDSSDQYICECYHGDLTVTKAENKIPCNTTSGEGIIIYTCPITEGARSSMEEGAEATHYMLTQVPTKSQKLMSQCLSDSDCSLIQQCLNKRCVDLCSYEDCGTDAYCVVNNHQAMCTCPEGYAGDPYAMCIRLPVVDGNWGDWTEWSEIDTTTGAKTRTRECDNPKPLNGGASCEGPGIGFENTLLSIAACDPDKCVPIRSCEEVTEKLSQAQRTNDTFKRQRLMKEVHELVCSVQDRKVCCPSAQQPPDTEVDQQAGGSGTLTKIGGFIKIFHDIGGTAYAVGDKELLLEGFTYDGRGPDTFFLAGTNGMPSPPGDVVLPWKGGKDFSTRVYAYSDKAIPILRAFGDPENITLTIPQGSPYTVEDLKWLSVWDRDSKVNFGHVTFPSDFSLQ